MSKLLIDESPHQVLPTLACVVGLKPAIVLQQTHFRLRISEYKRGGHQWLPRSLEGWAKEFPYLKEPTLRRVIEWLEAQGLFLSTDVWNTKGSDRTKWYRIDYEALETLLSQTDKMKADEVPDQNDQLILRKDSKEDLEDEEEIDLSSLISLEPSLVIDLNATTIWQTAFAQLRLQMPKEAFDTWLRNAQLIDYQGGDGFVPIYTLGVPNTYAQQWLEHRLKRIVVRTLTQIAGEAVDVRFALCPAASIRTRSNTNPNVT